MEVAPMTTQSLCQRRSPAMFRDPNEQSINELREKHQPYMSQRSRPEGSFKNCEACSTGRGMQGGIGWPCEVTEMITFYDQLAEAYDIDTRGF